MKFSKTALSTLSAAVVGFLALGIASTPAGATVATAPIAVSATVASYCTVSATAMAFGTYSAAVDSASTSATITVTCSTGAGYTLGLNGGLTGTTTARVMTKGANTLNYGLYTDSGRSTNFVTLSGLTGTGVAQNTTVYGKIPAAQYVPSGDYADTVTATVTY